AALTATAEAGDAHAQFLLALRCEDGTDGPADPAAAAHWYERAAAQGFAPAQNNLGLLLFRGRGVERSREGAQQWFERAAAQDFVAAHTNLGVMRLCAEPRDVTGARVELLLAAEHGDAKAQALLGSLCEEGIGQPVDPATAAHWYGRAADQDHAVAQLRLG